MHGPRTTFIPLTYGKISLIHVHFEVVFAKIPRHFPHFSNLGVTLMLKFWKQAKYIENSRLNKHHYCFENISTTKAPIFMKFKTYIHKIVKNYPKIFRNDLCTHVRTWCVNVRVHVLPRRNTRVHVYNSCALVCARIFMKNLLVILYYLINISLKFHKDQRFRCGDICKTILTFFNH